MDDHGNNAANRLVNDYALTHQPLADVLALKERALAAAAEGITIVDARLPDTPLIYVNAGFERLTGYSADEVLGRNCRFLQGSNSAGDTVDEIRAAVRARRECTVEILNDRKDGTQFWNRLSITPVCDESGDVTHFIGIQSDVTARRRAEEAREEALKEIKVANLRMKTDLDAAARLQRELLPVSTPRYAGMAFAWAFEPCDELAGDTLNILPLDDEHVALFLLDVSGHGVPAALLSVTLSRWLSADPERSCLYTRPAGAGPGGRGVASPNTVVERLNREFPMTSSARQYFTMVYGVFNTRTRELRSVVAGHPPPIHVAADGGSRELNIGGPPVGMFADAQYEEQVLRLAAGDRLFLYSDGLSEVRDDKDRELGRERLAALLNDSHEIPLHETLSGIVAAAKRWCGRAGIDDDLSILALEAGL